MSASAVAVQQIAKRFGARAALDGVSWNARGGVITLLGPNGAGKTTLLRCVATVTAADAGTIHVDGLDARVSDERVRIRQRLGYLPQHPRFAPGARVVDVLDYVGILKQQHSRRRRHAEVERVLHEVGLTDQRLQKMKTLSGGMVRRVGIAQALLGDPRLLVLDEPAAGLDPEQRLELRDRLSRLAERATVLVSTHLTDEAAAFSQSLLVLDRGRIVYHGTPAGLTATAHGRVWSTWEPPAPGTPGIRRSWRTPGGWYRCIGDPPAAAHLDQPTLEDAYLLLVGERPSR